jgi:hypothetical protein
MPALSVYTSDVLLHYIPMRSADGLDEPSCGTLSAMVIKAEFK